MLLFLFSEKKKRRKKKSLMGRLIMPVKLFMFSKVLWHHLSFKKVVRFYKTL